MALPDPNGVIVIPDVFVDLCSYAGELTGWWAPAIAGALSVLASAFVVWRARRRRRAGRSGRSFWWGSSIGVGFGVLLTVALAVNSWVGYFPSFAALARWTNGAHQDVALSDSPTGNRQQTSLDRGVAIQVTIPSTSTRVPTGSAWVYLPPGYDEQPAESYDVVVGLHGDPGKGGDWFVGGDIQTTLDLLINARALPPVIFISPDLSSGMGVNYREPVNVPNGPAIEDFVATDVVNWADSNLRTQAGPEHHVVMGFSSGGFGSLVIGLRHTDVFGGIVSIIPYTVPYTTAIKNDPQLLSEYNPALAIPNAETIPPTFLGMAGAETPKNGNALAAALSARGARFTKRVFETQPHTWQTARIIAPYALVWIAQQLGWVAPISGDMSGFPTACTPTVS